ncbi:MAG: PocR ligand-binding domain-containing protein, partial [Candidatus Sumerlaeota bacterium]
FDANGKELKGLNVKEMSPFCRELRKDMDFRRACLHCDWQHLEDAREKGEPCVYECYAGLLEAAVPLYDRNDHYLGSLVFGQMRPARRRPSHRIPQRYHSLFRELPESSKKDFARMAELLRLTSEAIIEKEMVRLRRPNWADVLRDYIEENLSEDLTIEKLAEVLDISPSYVTQHFPQVFGETPKRYIRRRRLESGLNMLKAGMAVNLVAQATGFCDAFHFSKVFKQEYGAAPTRYLAGEKPKDHSRAHASKIGRG